MKFVVEDGFSKLQKTGIGQYTLMIEKLLNELNCEIVNIEKPFLKKIKNKILRRILYNFWLNSVFLIKLLLINDKVTVFCTNYAIPIFKLKKVIFIPVIHDLCMFNFPQYSSKLINSYEKSNVNNALKTADKIITVSNSIKQEIIKRKNYPANKIYVVNNSFSTEFLNEEEYPFKLLKDNYKIEKEKYILSVATNNKRKNIATLIENFEKISLKYPDIKLVLTGSGYKTSDNKNIITTGYIADAELKCLYENAMMYVFPSIYEGFGIPIIDAQSFGIPVICSDIPVFREVSGNGAEFFKLNTEELRNKIEMLIKNEQNREELVKKGFENIKRYSLDIIKEQLNSCLGGMQ